MNTSFGYISTKGGVHVTSNGGVSWQSPDYSAQPEPIRLIMQGALLYDAYFLDNMTGIGVGVQAFTEDYIIKTVDGGLNWSIVHMDNATGDIFTGLRRVHFTTATSGIAVGSKGHIVRTSDGGNTWTADASLTTQDINDLQFLDSQNGFLLGVNTLFRTSDGGITWTPAPTPAEGLFQSVFFTSPSDGTIVTALGGIFKTTDGGVSWSRNLVESNEASRVYFTDASTGYIAGNGLLKTNDGGIRWEQVDQTFPERLTSITFINSSTGYVAGTNGYLAKTVNAGGPTLPVALFTDNFNPCNRLIQFGNYGNPADTYQWYVNGQPQSAAYDFAFTFEDGLNTVMLEVNRGSYTGSFTRNYTFTSPFTPGPVTASVENTHVCANFPFGVVINGAQSVVTYRLLDGATVLAGPTIGGTTFTMHVASGIPSSRTLTIEATSSNGCDAITTNQSFPVTVLPASYALDVHIDRSTVCEGEELVVEVRNTLPGVRYTITKLGLPWEFTGDGSTRTFTWLPPLTGETVVVNGDLYCSVLQDIQPVDVDHPRAQFMVPRLDYFLDEEVMVTNESTPGASQWDFGVGADPSNLTQPAPVTYTLPGKKKLHLEIESVFGCKHVKDTALWVFNRSPLVSASSCVDNPAPSVPSQKFIRDSQFDTQGNLYQTGYTWDPVGDFGHSHFFFFLEKLSPTGTPLWKKEVVYDGGSASALAYRSTYGMALDIDADGNVYTAASFKAGSVSLNDGTVFLPNTLFPSSGSFQWAVMKHAPDGTLLWKVHAFGDDNLVPHIVADVILDVNNNVFVTSYNQGPYHFQWGSGMKNISGASNGEGTLSLMKVSSSGEYLEHRNFGGAVMLEPPNTTGNSDPPLINSPLLAADLEGNIIVAGLSFKTMTFGGTTLTTNNELRPFLARFNIAWREAHLGPLLGHPFYSNRIHGLESDGQSVYLSGGWTTDYPEEFLSPIWNGTVDGLASDNFVMKWNYTGNIEWARFTKNLKFTRFGITPQRVLAYGSTLDFGIYDTFGQQAGIRTEGGEDAVLASIQPDGILEWMYSIGDNQAQGGVALGPTECTAVSIATAGGTSAIRRISTGGCNGTPPVLTVNEEEITICPGGSTQLQVSGAVSYEWLPAAGLSDATLANPIALPTISTTYTVTGYAGDCWSVKKIKVRVAPSALTFETFVENRTAVFKLSEEAEVQWNFGDGTTSTVSSPVHTFPADGDYTVCVTAVNGCPAPAGQCKVLTFHCDPEADFTLSQNPASLEVTLFNQTSGGLYFVTDFGDDIIVEDFGGFSFRTHLYEQPGTYTVCLTATNACNSVTSCHAITVVEPACPGVTTASFTEDHRERRQVFFLNQTTGNMENPVWDFGDGGSSTELHPAHTFSMDGVYDVCLTIGPPCGRKQFCAQVVGCDKPDMDFSYGIQNLDVSFTNLSSSGFSYVWHFGDGSSSTEVSPVHHYAVEGSYYVTLIAFDGCQGATVKELTIICPLPTIPITAEVVDLTVTVSSPLTNADSWTWDFGDGQTSTAASLSHTYASEGTRTVSLAANNACGERNEQIVIDIICPLPEVATFDYVINEQTVQFTPTGTDITTWQWSFGDNEQSNMQNPVHEFDAPGTYEVCLVSGNGCGTREFCEDIVISDAITGLLDASRMFHYPNPVRDLLHIRFEGIRATHAIVYDQKGREIMNQQISLTTEAFSLDFSGLTAGIYLIRCFSEDGGSVYRKVIKQ